MQFDIIKKKPKELIDLLDYAGFPAPIKNFLSYKLNIQNCSPKTVYEYSLDLRAFFTFVSEKRRWNNVFSELNLDDIKAVTTEDIYEYLLHIASDNNNGASSRARKLCAIRVFYKYCTVKAKLFEADPAKDIESPKVRQALPRYLTLEESRDLLSAVANSSDRNRYRDYAILTLFLNCGMRLSELTGLSLSDIPEDMSRVRVLGKGSKERVLYLNDACRAALKDYLSVRSSLSCSDRNALWVSRQGKRMTDKSIQYTVKKWLRLAGLGGRHFSTHKLRHTAATLMYTTGKVDVRVLKDILGHEQLNTTQIYTHVSDEQMQSAVNKNPLAEITIKKQ